MKFNSGLRDSALTAFRDSIPVMMGYLPLGFVFGFLFAQAGAAAWMAPICSIIVYGGASQYMMEKLQELEKRKPEFNELGKVLPSLSHCENAVKNANEKSARHFPSK